MQVTLIGKDLAAALKAVMSVIENSHIPILKGVRLTSHPDRLTLTATDLDMWLTVDVDIQSGIGQLDIVIPAAMLYAIVRYAGPAPVDIQLVDVTIQPSNKDAEPYTRQDVRVTIAGGDQVFDLHEYECHPASDWPDPSDTGEWRPYESFTNSQLSTMFEKVSPAICNEETRYYLNGVYWEPGIFTATDGHRLISYPYAAMRQTPEGSNSPVSLIIPRKAVRLVKTLAGDDVQTAVSTKERVRFTFGDMVLMTKTIDGTYPNYRRVIPKRDPAATHIKFDAERLRQALRSAVAFYKAVKTRNGIAIRKHDDGSVVLSTHGTKEPRLTEGGTFVGKTFADWPKDSVMTYFGLNMHYLLAMLPKAGTVTLASLDAGTPIHVDHHDEPDVTRIIMPMRV